MIVHPRTLDRPHLVRVEAGAIGAGNNFTWTPPVRQHVEIISLQVLLTTDATAADRRMVIVWGGVADDDVAVCSQIIQPASQTWAYWSSRGLGNTLAGNVDFIYMIPMPIGLVFAAPAQIRSDIVNIQAGDQIIGYRIRYQTWQDPVFLV